MTDQPCAEAEWLVRPEMERVFYDDLHRFRGEVVPVVGAGLALDAGAPSSTELCAGLLAAAATVWTVPPQAQTWNLFELADALAAEVSERWVQDQVALLVQASPTAPTLALRALAKVPSKLIVTTNYDLAIEVSAEALGIPVRSLTLNEFDFALTADETLRVLHLHGVATEPTTIVLANGSYEAIAADERAQFLVRDLAIRHRLVFLGQRLVPREAHVRRDLRWVTDVAMRSAASRKHLLIISKSEPAEVEVQAWVEEVRASSGVSVLVFSDPADAHLATLRCSRVLSGPSSLEEAGVAPPGQPVNPHYLPLPVAQRSDMADPTAFGAYLAQTWQEGQISASALDTEVRLLLVGPGGYGKSEELRQSGRRAALPALLGTFGAWGTLDPLADPGAAFVSLMARAASASASDVPRLTLPLLRESAFVFLLDGLDQLTSGRDRAVDLLNELVRRYPQHRWVVASRWVPELAHLQEFTPLTPVPDGTWLHEYAESRGVSEYELSQALTSRAELSDLVRIPVYAAAILDHLDRGIELPRAPAELVCHLADQQVTNDPLVGADPALVNAWLDRLALLLESQGRSEISSDDFRRTRLHHDLRGVAPSPKLLADLAVRALITDVAGMVRFPANVVQEARAARALVRAGDAGLDFLGEQVLLTLPVDDLTGNPVRGIRPGWVSTVRLALSMAPEPWWEAVAAVDPLLTARCTPSDASQEQRHAAAHALWETYLDRRVWMGAGGGLRDDDAAAIVRLVASDIELTFRDELVDALHDPERTRRGNALRVLAGVLDDAALAEIVRNALTDDDPVVRRLAASAAVDRQLSALAAELAERGGSDPDELAAETLIDAAVRLATDDQALAIADTVTVGVANRVMHALVDRLPRLRLLEHLQQSETLNEPLLEAITGSVFRAVERTTWSSPEVAALTQLAARYPDATHGGRLELILAQHPAAFLAARTCHPVDMWFQHDLHRVLGESDLPALGELAGLLPGRHEDLVAMAGLTGPFDVDPEALTEAAAVLDAVCASRRRPPTEIDKVMPLTVTGQAAPSKNLNADAVAAGLEEILASGELAGVLASWTGTVSRELLRRLGEAARERLPLTGESWALVASFALRWRDPDLNAWLLDTWDATVWEHFRIVLGELPTAEALRAGELVPAPWPLGLAETILALALLDGPSDFDRHHAAAFVAAKAGSDIVLTWSDQQRPDWLLPLLVELGCCEAEVALLQGWVAHPEQTPRWPLHQGADWLTHVRCTESADLIEAALLSALRGGRDINDVEQLYRAFDRCAGLDVLRRYDLIINDRELPGAAFQFYQREIALSALLEQAAAARDLSINELQLRIAELVPPSGYPPEVGV